MTMRPLLPFWLLSALAVLSPAAGSAHDAHAQAMHETHDSHAGHRHMLEQAGHAGYRRSETTYHTPTVTLTDSSGTPIQLAEFLNSDEPVILNFIYTSCSTVCPVLSATFSQAQDALASAPRKPRLVSISIDPDFDTPARLKTYAEKHHARGQWHFLTGDSASVIAIQRAFDVYRGQKSNHIPATFLRASADKPWIRLDGFTSASDLIREYGALIAN